MKTINIATLIKIADYFNTSVDYLVGHTDIDHIIEPIKSYDLNDDESDLIDNYRELSEKQKIAIKAVIKSYKD